MMTREPSAPQTPKALMARSPVRGPKPSMLADTLVFAGGAAVALILFWSLYSFFSPAPTPTQDLSMPSIKPSTQPLDAHPCAGLGLLHDSPAKTFYDDPTLPYTIERPIKNWDEKRREWLRRHPSLLHGANERILMVSGSQPGPCRNPVGDHLLLRFYKNKADYCRLHRIEMFYNMALLHPEMFTFWAKIPVVRAAMVAHPEAEWVWWVDSDAAFTDMEFELPLARYRAHNLVVHGWPKVVYEARSWTSLNAGVFLIRNCQWSLDFMDVWARMGPQSPEYEQWGKTLKAEFKDKIFPESDDQSGLVYLLLKQNSQWGDKIYLENEYYFEGYWVEIVNKLHNISERYLAMEKKAPELRRRRAEKVAAAVVGPLREKYLKAEGLRSGLEGWRRPFITHFTGCQPCSGAHNKIYSGENCWEGMRRALDFADDQVLRAYGFRHRQAAAAANFSAVNSLPFDFPAAR